MPNFDHLPCGFCNHEAGEWKNCPRCEAPKTDIGKWLAHEKWEVPVAGKKNCAYYHRHGTYWTRLTKFPGALFDPSGYVLFSDEETYLNCKGLRIGKQTNIESGIKLAELDGFVVGNPPIKREWDFEETPDEENEVEGGYVYALRCRSAWDEYVKIGKAIDVDRRIGDYQTYSPHRDYEKIGESDYSMNYDQMELMAHAIARQLSNDFDAKEWFKITPDQARQILSLVSGSKSL